MSSQGILKKSDMEKISYVVPCYGSEHTIEKVISNIRSVMNDHKEYDYEVILVNDNSPDNVWSVIENMCSKDKRIKAICLARNFGQHSALMAGYNICSGDYVVTIDDDGQTPVNQTFYLVEELLKGYDVVYGKYADRKDNSFRKFGTAVNNYMLETLIGKPKDIHLTSFFVARRYIIKEICNYRNAFPYIWGLILRTTKNIANVTIEHSERIDGESGYTLGKLLSLWMNGFTAFSVKPLRVSAIGGIIFACVGVVGILYTVINKILRPEIMAGYSSLMSMLLIIGGMLMLSMGLIGEYIGRIYLCINTMPQYVVKKKINSDEEEE